MSSYDMNENNDDIFYVKLLKRKSESNNAKFPTFRLMQFAKDNNINELIDMLSDVDIYFDLNDQKKYLVLKLSHFMMIKII